MELHNTIGSFKQIRLKKALNALLISDLHFTEPGNNHFIPRYFSFESIEKTMSFLPPLITKIKPDQIFILGDLFHAGQSDNQFVTHIMSWFTHQEQEIIVIGGNHDRKLIPKLLQKRVYKTMQIITDPFLQYETKFDKIWLTHDGNNPFRLHKPEIPDFLVSLKEGYDLSQNYWLVTGHTHYPFMIEEKKIGSIGSFNYENSNDPLSYGIVREDQGQITLILDKIKLDHQT
ncbi:MAG: metallophosphoesterase [Candidatus Hodarchaeales archaeon]|jgi:UDP-2,3-diacylglucosamine pyrophosphatase LpxH